MNNLFETGVLVRPNGEIIRDRESPIRAGDLCLLEEKAFGSTPGDLPRDRLTGPFEGLEIEIAGGQALVGGERLQERAREDRRARRLLLMPLSLLNFLRSGVSAEMEPSQRASLWASLIRAISERRAGYRVRTGFFDPSLLTLFQVLNHTPCLQLLGLNSNTGLVDPTRYYARIEDPEGNFVQGRTVLMSVLKPNPKYVAEDFNPRLSGRTNIDSNGPYRRVSLL